MQASVRSIRPRVFHSLLLALTLSLTAHFAQAQSLAMKVPRGSS